MGGVVVRLLGSVEAGRDDQVVEPVPGSKLQALVGLLALAVPHPVSADRLIDELWGDEQPGQPGQRPAGPDLPAATPAGSGPRGAPRRRATCWWPTPTTSTRPDSSGSCATVGARRRPGTSRTRPSTSVPHWPCCAGHRSRSWPTTGSPGRPPRASASWSSPPTRASPTPGSTRVTMPRPSPPSAISSAATRFASGSTPS